MTGLMKGVTSALKNITVKLLTEKFFVFVLFFAAESIAKKTTNKLDDKFVAKVKELYEQG